MCALSLHITHTYRSSLSCKGQVGHMGFLLLPEQIHKMSFLNFWFYVIYQMTIPSLSCFSSITVPSSSNTASLGELLPNFLALFSNQMVLLSFI